MKEKLIDVDPKKIRVTGWNPRKSFPKEKMNELKESIQTEGIKERLRIRSSDSKKFDYDLIDGERRLKISKDLKMKTVPCILVEADDWDVQEYMCLTFFQKEGINAVEEAGAVKILLEKEPDQDSLGKKIGKSQGWISNRLRILEAPKDVLDLVEKGYLTAKHVITILKTKDHPKLMKGLIGTIKAHYKDDSAVSVSEVEDLLITEVKDLGVCITDLPWNIDLPKRGYVHKQYYEKQFDKNPCDSCKDSWKKGKKIYCLKLQCFFKKVEEIMAKQDAKEEKKEKGSSTPKKVRAIIEKNKEIIKAGKKPKDLQKVDIGKIQSSSYQQLGTVGFDLKECRTGSCGHYNKSTKGYEICFDHQCYTRKVNREQKLAKLQIREDNRRSLEALNLLLDEAERGIKLAPRILPDGVLDMIIKFFFGKLNGEQPEVAYEPFGEFTRKKHSWYGTVRDFGKAIKILSYNDKMILLTRLALLEKYASYKDSFISLKEIKKHVDGMDPFYKLTSPDSSIFHVMKKETHKNCLCGYPKSPHFILLDEVTDDHQQEVECSYCFSKLPEDVRKTLTDRKTVVGIDFGKPGESPTVVKTKSIPKKKGKKEAVGKLDGEERVLNTGPGSKDKNEIRESLKAGKIKPKPGGEFTKEDPPTMHYRHGASNKILCGVSPAFNESTDDIDKVKCGDCLDKHDDIRTEKAPGRTNDPDLHPQGEVVEVNITSEQKKKIIDGDLTGISKGGFASPDPDLEDVIGDLGKTKEIPVVKGKVEYIPMEGEAEEVTTDSRGKVLRKKVLVHIKETEKKMKGLCGYKVQKKGKFLWVLPDQVKEYLEREEMGLLSMCPDCLSLNESNQDTGSGETTKDQKGRGRKKEALEEVKAPEWTKGITTTGPHNHKYIDAGSSENIDNYKCEKCGQYIKVYKKKKTGLFDPNHPGCVVADKKK